MAILNSKIIAVNSSQNRIDVFNKYLNQLESSTSAISDLSNYIVDWIVDRTNNKVWILTSSSKIHRFSITENSQTGVVTINREATITVNFFNNGPFFAGKSLAVDEKTGALYYLYKPNAQRVVYRIPMTQADGSSVTTGGITLNSPSSSYNTGASIINDYLNNKLIVHQGYTSTGISVLNHITEISYDLASATYLTADAGYSGTQNMIYNSSILATRYVIQQQTAYNPITCKVLYTGEVSAYTNRLRIYDPIYGTMGFNRTNIYDETTTERIIWCGQKTGNHISVVNQTLYIHDYLFNRILKTTFPNVHELFFINTLSEEIYRIVSGVIYYYDRFANPLSSTTVFNFYYKHAFCFEGTNEVAPHSISPNRIVYPTGPLTISTGTPTIIFQVGVNPAGWTQQFRICMDKDLNKITNGTETTQYDRVFDTWANGQYYDANCNFKFSTDYNITSLNPESGTWTVLGSGDGLQSGGTVPTNGVSCTNISNPVYVKFTVPVNKALDGIDSGQVWYIKVYSYSKYV